MGLQVHVYMLVAALLGTVYGTVVRVAVSVPVTPEQRGGLLTPSTGTAEHQSLQDEDGEEPAGHDELRQREVALEEEINT